jgi:ribosomal protein L37AE/L43A
VNVRLRSGWKAVVPGHLSSTYGDAKCIDGQWYGYTAAYGHDPEAKEVGPVEDAFEIQRLVEINQKPCKWTFWTCPKCAAPMERTMRSHDYWMCRFCGHQMDGWYPDVDAQQIRVFEGDEHLHEGFVARADTTLDYQRILVPTGPREASHPSGRRHHFDSDAVRAALRGEKDDA